MNVEDEERWRPLHHAAHTGSHRVLQLLLRAPGVDVNAASNKRWRPIDVCITGEAARMLLNAGAVQSPEKPGSLSALHHAAANARLDVVEVLLARGAKVSETCSPEATRKAFNGEQFGGTALHYASMGLAVARCIKSNMGSSFDVVSPELASAQDAGLRRAAICAALVRAGADIDERTIPASVRRGEVPDTDSWPMTPLALAAQAGDAPVIKALLHAGAKVDQIVVDEAGIAALHLAAYLGNTDAIRALVAGGADVRSTPSPLLGAVSHNRHSAVRALLELGADSSGFASILARPAAQRPRPFMNVDETTCALVAQHRSGRMMPARACSLPDCDARRQADYDDKRLLKCPCKVRRPASSFMIMVQR